MIYFTFYYTGKQVDDLDLPLQFPILFWGNFGFQARSVGCKSDTVKALTRWRLLPKLHSQCYVSWKGSSLLRKWLCVFVFRFVPGWRGFVMLQQSSQIPLGVFDTDPHQNVSCSFAAGQLHCLLHCSIKSDTFVYSGKKPPRSSVYIQVVKFIPCLLRRLNRNKNWLKIQGPIFQNHPHILKIQSLNFISSHFWLNARPVGMYHH